MSADPAATAFPRSRRALLAAGLAAGTAAVAATVARPLTVAAANGEAVLVGNSFAATSTTTIGNTTTAAPVIVANSVTGVALVGSSDSERGVEGVSNSASGVQGVSTTGYGVEGASASSPGVRGWSTSGSSVGVEGASDSLAGVSGISVSGVGVLATSPGIALQVAGKAKFSRAGRASIPKNKTYVDVVVAGGLAANSVVSATLQTYRAGVGVAAVRANYPVAGKARIYLTKVASTTTATSVGWFVAEY